MTSEEIQESRKEAESAGWVKLTTKGPEEWGWCGYRVMRYGPGEWWGYKPTPWAGHAGLGINMKTREEAQKFCEDHYYDHVDSDVPRRGEPI